MSSEEWMYISWQKSHDFPFDDTLLHKHMERYTYSIHSGNILNIPCIDILWTLTTSCFHSQISWEKFDSRASCNLFLVKWRHPAPLFAGSLKNLLQLKTSGSASTNRVKHISHSWLSEEDNSSVKHETSWHVDFYGSSETTSPMPDIPAVSFRFVWWKLIQREYNSNDKNYPSIKQYKMLLEANVFDTYQSLIHFYSNVQIYVLDITECQVKTSRLTFCRLPNIFSSTRCDQRASYNITHAYKTRQIRDASKRERNYQRQAIWQSLTGNTEVLLWKLISKLSICQKSLSPLSTVCIEISQHFTNREPSKWKRSLKSYIMLSPSLTEQNVVHETCQGKLREGNLMQVLLRCILLHFKLTFRHSCSYWQLDLSKFSNWGKRKSKLAEKFLF